MSRCLIETTKKTMINGTEYSTKIKKDVSIDFSAANYESEFMEEGKSGYIELHPDNMDFLHEVTDLFPLSGYDIKIVQHLYRHAKHHVSLYLHITNKETGEQVYLADNAVLSDNDYKYIHGLLANNFPQYGWQSAENYLRSDIESYMSDINPEDLFTDDAFNILCRMVSARYMEYKIDGLVDYDENAMETAAKQIIEDALERAAADSDNGNTRC